MGKESKCMQQAGGGGGVSGPAGGLRAPPALQVHRAMLRLPGGELRAVAVKVCHPRVATIIHQDFQLLMPLAKAAGSLALFKGLSLYVSVIVLLPVHQKSS